MDPFHGTPIRAGLWFSTLLVACPNHLEPSLSGGDQPVRAGRPFERLRLLPVVKLDEAVDRRLEILEGIMDAAPETAAGQLPEEALDRVHPGAGGRREVEGPAGMVRKPVIMFQKFCKMLSKKFGHGKSFGFANNHPLQERTTP